MCPFVPFLVPAAAMLARTALSRGIVAHRLSKNVTLYTNEVASPASRLQTKTSEDCKPLTLMLPWLGSRPQAVAKYCEIYFRTGFDVLVVESEVWIFKIDLQRFIHRTFISANLRLLFTQMLIQSVVEVSLLK